MTRILNLYAGPGAGKSTIAAKTFALLKEAGANVELVTEYVKQWAWAERKPVNFDQFYFFGKQTQRETSLFNKVDVIVTDAPALLTCYYAQVYGSPQQAALFRNMFLTYREMCEREEHFATDVFLERAKPYDKRGRYQDENAAREIDTSLKRYLSEVGVKFSCVAGDENCAATLASRML